MKYQFDRFVYLFDKICGIKITKLELRDRIMGVNDRCGRIMRCLDIIRRRTLDIRSTLSILITKINRFITIASRIEGDIEVKYQNVAKAMALLGDGADMVNGSIQDARIEAHQQFDHINDRISLQSHAITALARQIQDHRKEMNQLECEHTDREIQKWNLFTAFAKDLCNHQDVLVSHLNGIQHTLNEVSMEQEVNGINYRQIRDRLAEIEKSLKIANHPWPCECDICAERRNKRLAEKGIRLPAKERLEITAKDVCDTKAQNHICRDCGSMFIGPHPGLCKQCVDLIHARALGICSPDGATKTNEQLDKWDLAN